MLDYSKKLIPWHSFLAHTQLELHHTAVAKSQENEPQKRVMFDPRPDMQNDIM